MKTTPRIKRQRYVPLRRLAWAARSTGDVAQAQFFEDSAEGCQHTDRWEEQCDELASNPGTEWADWDTVKAQA